MKWLQRVTWFENVRKFNPWLEIQTPPSSPSRPGWRWRGRFLWLGFVGRQWKYIKNTCWTHLNISVWAFYLADHFTVIGVKLLTFRQSLRDTCRWKWLQSWSGHKISCTPQLKHRSLICKTLDSGCKHSILIHIKGPVKNFTNHHISLATWLEGNIQANT